MGCNCHGIAPQYVVAPSPEQTANTWSDRGYFPGLMGCIVDKCCKHITSYNDMNDKPSINGVTLEGNKTCVDLKLMCAMRPITNAQIDEMFAK